MLSFTLSSGLGLRLPLSSPLSLCVSFLFIIIIFNSYDFITRLIWTKKQQPVPVPREPTPHPPIPRNHNFLTRMNLSYTPSPTNMQRGLRLPNPTASLAPKTNINFTMIPLPQNKVTLT